MFHLACLAATGSPGARVLRVLPRVLTAALLLATFATAVRAEERRPERREELVVFFDRSDSMNRLVPGGSVTYYQAALASAMEEIRFALESGTPVRVVPFHEVTTQNPRDTLTTPGALPLGEQLTTIRNVYLEKPVPNRGARVSDTVLAVMPLLVDGGRRPAVSVYTAEQDKSDVVWAQVGLKLKEKFGDAAPEVKVRNPSKGLPAHAGVKVSGALILDADAFAKGADGAAGKAVDVEAVFSASAGPTNTIEAVKEVKVTKVKADSPDLAVTAALMPALKAGAGAAATKGKVVLTATGNFPPGERHEYDLRFSFRFHALAQGTPDLITVGQPVRLVVVSELKPVPQVTVGKREVRLRPREYEDVVVSVGGNAAAAGKLCQLRALVTGAGLSAEFFPPDQKQPGADDKGKPNEIGFTLPAAGQRQEVVMRVRADRRGKGQVVVGAQVAAATDAAPPVNVNVQPPIVRVALGGKGDRVELDDGAAGASSGAFQDLLHPVTFKVESASKGLTATLTVDGDDKDVEVAFDDGQGKKVKQVTVPLDASAAVPVYGRLKSMAPRSPPSMPSVRVALSDPDVVMDPPVKSLALDGAAGLRAADLWLSSADADAAQPAAGGGRTLTLESRKIRAGQADDREVVLQWNPAAVGSTIAVAAESPDGGRVVSVTPLAAGDGPGAGVVADPANPWRLTIPPPARGPAGRPRPPASASTSSRPRRHRAPSKSSTAWSSRSSRRRRPRRRRRPGRRRGRRRGTWSRCTTSRPRYSRPRW